MTMKGVALVVMYTFLVMVVAPKAITCVAYQGSVSQRYGCVTLTMTCGYWEDELESVCGKNIVDFIVLLKLQ